MCFGRDERSNTEHSLSEIVYDSRGKPDERVAVALPAPVLAANDDDSDGGDEGDGGGDAHDDVDREIPLGWVGALADPVEVAGRLAVEVVPVV